MTTTISKRVVVIDDDGPSHVYVAEAAAKAGYGETLPEDYSDGEPVIVAGGVMPKWMAEIYGSIGRKRGQQ